MAIYTKISPSEKKVLYGLRPFLVKLYILVFREFMDYKTGIVGLKRRISLDAIAQEMYVENEQGIPRSQTGKPHTSKIRRSIEQLKKVGLLQPVSKELPLVFKCLLAERDYSVQNTPDAITDAKLGAPQTYVKPITTGYTGNEITQADTQADAQADTSPVKAKRYKKEKINKKEKGLTLCTPFPEWLAMDTWNDFLEHRKQLKKPLSQKAESLTINKLTQLRNQGQDPAAVLEQSIMNGWISIFPVKGDSHAKTQYKPAAAKAIDNILQSSVGVRYDEYKPCE